MSRVAVRGIEPGDELQAAEVERLATNDLRKVYRPAAEALEQRAALVASLRGLVAVIDQRIVGVVQYRITAGHLWVLGLGVDPAARRRGVARALVQHLERIARSCGCTAVGLHTVRETGNVEIFERLGFVVQSEAPTDLFESQTFPELSEVVMSKRIVPLSPGGQKENRSV